jgi:tetratricopeptide (TPR) repeat protein
MNPLFSGTRFLLRLFALMLMGWAQVASAGGVNDVSTRFDLANKLYEQGKYTEAAGQYQDILRERVASPALYFNLGNAFFKTGQLGRAIAAYCQAEQLAPRDPDLRANLQFVRNQIQGPTLVPDHWQSWLGRFTLNEWSGLAMIVLWVWFGLLILLQLRPGLRSALRGYLYTAGIFAAGLWLCIAWLVYLRQTEHKAVVTASEVVAHNGPLDESPAAFTVHDGAELRVLDEKDQWLQVNVGATTRPGWVRRDQIIILPQT